MTIKLALGGLLLSSLLYAESVEDAMGGFDDVPVKVEQSDDIMDGFDDTSTSLVQVDSQSIDQSHIMMTEPVAVISGFTGKITEQIAYSYNGKKPHNNITSLKSSLFLDYEHKFENRWRVKANAKAYYDAIYDLRDERYSQDELNEQRSEVRLFDAYVEGSITERLDMKLGRQVVVWGRSDTIRITDVLNPLDNRRPALVDIEDLRLPVTMAKFDFFMGNWRITPIAVLEQHFSITPAFGSAFNPAVDPNLAEKSYKDVTYALSVGGEFTGWDVNFYAARLHDDAGYVDMSAQPTITHDKVTMFGTALNVLTGSWLFKTELAYFNGLKYTATQDKSFKRTDALIGTEYKGIADTLISYDISLRHLNNYDVRLLNERTPLEKDTYQHAFRVSSDFMNASLTANYLISLYGKKLDEGGFQRAWVKYELGEGINTNFGVVDYIGGSTLFDSVKDNDMIFADISYSF